LLRELQTKHSAICDRLASSTDGASGTLERDRDKLAEELAELEERARYLRPADRAIVSLGIPGLVWPTEEGRLLRFVTPGKEISLTVISRGRPTWPNTMKCTVVDSHQPRAPIDTPFVYAPFDTLQRDTGMDAEYSDEGKVVAPPRCSQIHIRVRSDFHDSKALDTIRRKVAMFLAQKAGAFGETLRVTTWEQHQASDLAVFTTTAELLRTILRGEPSEEALSEVQEGLRTATKLTTE